jgi:diguanylate cyclase (GGDEF)-like protein
VLREVGFLLKRIVQRGDATVARYGGDEFVMILPDTTLDAGLALCEEIRRTIEETSFLDREWGFSMPPVHLRRILSASIGIARHIPDCNSTTSFDIEKNELLRRADAAMYQAKALGKNQVVVWNPAIVPGERGALSDAAAT